MKTILPIGIIAFAILVGTFLISNNNGNTKIDKPSSASVGTEANESNVIIEDGKQIININVNGGYSPRKSVAKAGMPTIIRFITKSTFDCSSSIAIRSLNISKVLPNTGETDVDIGVSALGKLNGTCGMGMYSFQIDFN